MMAMKQAVASQPDSLQQLRHLSELTGAQYNPRQHSQCSRLNWIGINSNIYIKQATNATHLTASMLQ